MPHEQQTSSSEGTPSGSPLSLQAVDRANDRYPQFVSKRTITIPKQKLLSSNDVVFTMGSCFAEEIRRAMAARGQTCVPHYKRIAFDPAAVIVDTLPEREHMNFYNAFSICQQIEELLGLWEPDEDDYWKIGQLSVKIMPWVGAPNYQDPYRRLIVARTPELLLSTRRAVVAEMRRAFEEATAFIFTFGMTEVFRSNRSGKIVAQKPAYAGGGGLAETSRYDSTFSENLETVRRIVDLIRREKPGAPIILSVSPVPLARTFSPSDVVTASLEGKSILRAVLGQIVRDYDAVGYLPSYEYVMMQGATAYRQDDLRHVSPAHVEHIVDAFFAAFYR
ncbi:hypothetical protein MEX01_52250 [Methylorubrum extorquens]|nr:hypothetical protein MEX01_52250 [Methylorubrum extorquens]